MAGTMRMAPRTRPEAAGEGGAAGAAAAGAATEGDAGDDSALGWAAAAAFWPLWAVRTWTSRFMGEWPCRSRKVGDRAVAGATAWCDDPGRVGWAASGRVDDEDDGRGLPAVGGLAAAVALPDAGIVAAKIMGAGAVGRRQRRGRRAGCFSSCGGGGGGSNRKL
jgi:hypothetical protein